jgi:hypothetical protein
MSLTLSQGSQNYIKLLHSPWFGNPTKAPDESSTIRTHVPIFIRNDSYPDCVLVTDGTVTGWVVRNFVKIMQTYESVDEKIKLRKNANGSEYSSPVVELTKGAKVALLDGENRMSLVSTIVDGKVCSGWIPTAYLH